MGNIRRFPSFEKWAIFSLAFVMGSLVNILVISGTALFGLGQSFYHPLGGSVLNNSFSGKPYGTALGINSSTGSVGRSVVPLMQAKILILRCPELIYQEISG